MVGALLAAPAAVAQPKPPVPVRSTTHVLVAPRLASEGAVRYPEGAKGDANVVLTLSIDDDGAVLEATPVEANEPFSSEAASAAL
jgi:hypothetical protein